MDFLQIGEFTFSLVSAMLEHESPANSLSSSNNVTQVTTTTTLVKFHSNPTLNIRKHNFSTSSSSSTTHSYFMKSPTKGALTTGGGGDGGGSPTGESPFLSQSLSQFALNVQKGENDSDRPPFVTTVTRGKFLPSKFDLMVEKSLFSLANRPRPIPVVPSITKHQCSLSEGPLTSPRGVHDYYNMMWDPHVCRGKTSSTAATTMPPIKGRFGEQLDGEGGKVGDGNASEVKYRKKRASHYYSSLGGGVEGGPGNRYKITTRVTTKTKLPKLGLTDAASTRHLHHTHVQTEQFLEDLAGDATARFGPNDAVIQTDPIRRKTFSSRNRYAPMKNGVDVATQVLPGELVSTDEELQPVAESLVGKILHQALLETMEEEELAALREQQNKFQEKRKHEEQLLRELQEQHERVTQEKERLRMNLAEVSTGLGDSSPNEASNNVILDQVLRSAALHQSGVSTSYLIELLPSVLNSLRQEGFLSESAGDDLFSSFVPMWRSSSKADDSDVGEGIVMTNTAQSSGTNTPEDLQDEEPSKLNVTAEDKEEQEDDEEQEPQSVEDRSDHPGDRDETNSEGDNDTPGANEDDDPQDDTQEDDDPPASDDIHDEDTRELNNIQSSFEQPDSLPNGRIPSFERTGGNALQGEVV